MERGTNHPNKNMKKDPHVIANTPREVERETKRVEATKQNEHGYTCTHQEEWCRTCTWVHPDHIHYAPACRQYHSEFEEVA